jgi:uncharacterized protein
MSAPALLTAPEDRLRRQLAKVDWDLAGENLDARGFAVIDGLLSRQECQTIASLYADEAKFRSRILMARHGFGRGQYKYFSHPLPSLIATLRSDCCCCGLSKFSRCNSCLLAFVHSQKPTVGAIP